MKILYAIQGTGNGHLCRAMEILPIVKKYAKVDVLISGKQADLELDFEVKYRLNGVGFIFGKNGGVDYAATWKSNQLKSIINELRRLPVRDYDLVINDFEPISAWAAKLAGIPCVGMSHQAALLNEASPKPQHKDWFGAFYFKILRTHYKAIRISLQALCKKHQSSYHKGSHQRYRSSKSWTLHGLSTCL